MATETIEISRYAVETATSIADLKANIKGLKEELADLEIGSEEYHQRLLELNENQAALRNAMHGTAASMDEVIAAAKGANIEFDEQNKLVKNGVVSYNALVKKLADLTEAYRSTTDEVTRGDLAAQIKSVNDELKSMDESRGIFSRNVGNYAESIKKALKDIPSFAQPVKKAIDDTSKSLQLIGKQPVLGMVALLAPLVAKIAEALKENETALNAIDKLLAALKPVADFFSGVLEKIAGWLGSIVDWIIELGKNSGVTFNKIVAGAAGVGNAIYQFIATPIRNVIDLGKGLGQVFKNIFKGDFQGAVTAAKEAGKNMVDNFKEGFSFRTNFLTGQERGETFVAGLKSPKVKREAAAAGKEVAEAFTDPFANEELNEEIIPDFIWDPDGEIRAANQQLFDDLIAQQDSFLAAEDLRRQWEAAAAQAALDQQKQRDQERLQAFQQYAAAVSNVFGALADIYESNNDADEKATQKAKGLRTAAAIISTISGAISAYMNTIESVKIPAIAIPLAAINAAAVLAAGMAQIKQINAVKVGNSSGASGASLAAAPVVVPSVQRVRTMTGASEEERLNRMASDTRVYLVVSELEAKQKDQRVRIQESTF